MCSARQTALSSESEVSTALRSVLKNIAVVAASENGITAADITPLEVDFHACIES